MQNALDDDAKLKMLHNKALSSSSLNVTTISCAHCWWVREAEARPFLCMDNSYQNPSDGVLYECAWNSQVLSCSNSKSW